MTTQSMYNLALVLHITGLTMMAGSALSDYLMTRKFWVQYNLDLHKSMSLQQAMGVFPVMARTGFFVILLSGITMVSFTHGVFAGQTWFQVKMALVVLAVINGVVVKKALSARLTQTLAATAAGSETTIALTTLKSRLKTFHFSQMSLFIIIYILGVFKFN